GSRAQSNVALLAADGKRPKQTAITIEINDSSGHATTSRLSARRSSSRVAACAGAVLPVKSYSRTHVTPCNGWRVTGQTRTSRCATLAPLPRRRRSAPSLRRCAARPAGPVNRRARRSSDVLSRPRCTEIIAPLIQTDSKERGMSDSVYRVTEVIGTSPDSWEAAARTAVETAARSIRDLRVAEATRFDVTVKDGKIADYRVRLNISFKYETGD